MPRSRRHSFTREQVDHIGDRDGWRCVYCGNRGWVADHVHPVKEGGQSIIANGVISCVPCNNKKGSRLDVRYITVAFQHLLGKGEDLGWTDRLRKRRLPDVQYIVSKDAKVAKVLRRKVSYHVVSRPPIRFHGRPQGIVLTCRECQNIYHYERMRQWDFFCSQVCRNIWCTRWKKHHDISNKVRYRKLLRHF